LDIFWFDCEFVDWLEVPPIATLLPGVQSHRATLAIYTRKNGTHNRYFSLNLTELEGTFDAECFGEMQSYPDLNPPFLFFLFVSHYCPFV